MPKPLVEPVAGPFTLGEGPHWDEKTKSLYFVDIDGKAVLRYDSVKKSVTKCSLEKKVGFVIPIQDKANEFIIGYAGDFAILKWDGQSSTPTSVTDYVKGDPSPENRINDGKCDPTGRLWAGSMCHTKDVDGNWKLEKASLYTLDKNQIKTKLEKVHLSNGLAWSSDHTKFYYIDSLVFNVRSFDYDKATGDIGNEQIVFDLKEHNLSGIPDGMAIDAEDKLWVSVFSGAKILNVDPNSKKLLQTIDIPAFQTTSVSFGGDNYDELYVTSANVTLPNEEDNKKKNSYTHNGHLFKITGLGVKGLPPVNFKN